MRGSAVSTDTTALRGLIVGAWRAEIAPNGAERGVCRSTRTRIAGRTLQQHTMIIIHCTGRAHTRTWTQNQRTCKLLATNNTYGAPTNNAHITFLPHNTHQRKKVNNNNAQHTTHKTHKHTITKTHTSTQTHNKQGAKLTTTNRNISNSARPYYKVHTHQTPAGRTAHRCGTT